MPRNPTQTDSASLSVSLSSWSIRETSAPPARHFVGHDLETGTGHISTAIVHWDPRAMRGLTSSGHVYALIGPPGFDRPAEYQWLAWIFHSRIDEWRDVTADEIRDTPFAHEIVPVLVNWWTVMQHVTQGARYLVGYCSGTDEPLVTAEISTFDPATRCVGTDDGLSYRLAGHQMMNSDEFDLILWRFADTDESAWIDVGDDLWDQIFEYDEVHERKA
jgi:hypothetical protein